MARKLPVRSVVCTNCHARIDAAPRYSLLGLRRFVCPRCSASFLYPMSLRRRKWYVVVAVVFAALSVGLAVSAGIVALPGILPVAAAIALIQDSMARKKVAAAEGEGHPPSRPD
jgi:hypothetical protein